MFFEPGVENNFQFENFLKKVDEEEDESRDTREICRLHLKGECAKGRSCPDKHLRPDKAIVCEYWLRGICKKADQCEFMHEFDIRRMPECFYYAVRGECLNPECVFVHVNAEDEIKECPYYKRGFCSMGSQCKYKHIPTVLCPNYMAGFCPEGKMCRYAHPKFNHPLEDELADNPISYIPLSQRRPRRDFEEDAPNSMFGKRSRIEELTPQMNPVASRNLAEILCFKCGEKGHYANVCTNEKNWSIQGKVQLIKDTSQGTGGTGTTGAGGGYDPGVPRRPITCFFCGIAGHRVNECPTKPAGFRY